MNSSGPVSTPLPAKAFSGSSCFNSAKPALRVSCFWSLRIRNPSGRPPLGDSVISLMSWWFILSSELVPSTKQIWPLWTIVLCTVLSRCSWPNLFRVLVFKNSLFSCPREMIKKNSHGIRPLREGATKTQFVCKFRDSQFRCLHFVWTAREWPSKWMWSPRKRWRGLYSLWRTHKLGLGLGLYFRFFKVSKSINLWNLFPTKTLHFSISGKNFHSSVFFTKIQ